MEQKQEPRQDTRGMLRRMMRNKMVIVRAEPAKTPSQVVSQWAEESGVKKDAALELLERLRGSLPFDEDGCLQGKAVLDAIELQATLMRDCDWASANKLRISAISLREQFTRLGML